MIHLFQKSIVQKSSVLAHRRSHLSTNLILAGALSLMMVVTQASASPGVAGEPKQTSSQTKAPSLLGSSIEDAVNQPVNQTPGQVQGQIPGQMPAQWIPHDLLKNADPSFADGEQVDNLAEIESEIKLVRVSAIGSDQELERAIASEVPDAANAGALLAQNTSRTNRPNTRTAAAPAARASTANNEDYMARATRLVKSGQYQEASKLLFLMSRSIKFTADSAKIKYILGLVLSEMKLNQTAAFVLYDVVHQESHNTRSLYLRKALGKLAMAADALESDALLRYAIKQVNETDFPADKRDMLFYRLGESKLDDHQYADAATQFNHVRSNSIFYTRARYKLALSYAENNDPDRAVGAFDDMINQTSNENVTNPTRVAAELGKARVLYQKKDFAGAIEAYHVIPRDTEMWHEALFESSWAMFMDGRFRSALGNFHSLHSAFYEDFYQPESLLLRAIVYLYICRYEEMDKVLQLFERIYKPAQAQINHFVTSNPDPVNFWRELNRVQDNYDAIRTKKNRNSQPIPFLAARYVLKEPDVRHSMSYISKLDEEKKRISQLPASWQQSGIGAYARSIVDKRMDAARSVAGKQIKSHLIVMHNDLRSFFEQGDLARYEMLSGRKETIRKELAGKTVARRQVDDNNNRNFYIQNGYEYWPFTGEYWLDEIGNYHYVGVKACE